jgi:hypothetical protein
MSPHTHSGCSPLFLGVSKSNAWEAESDANEREIWVK